MGRIPDIYGTAQVEQSSDWQDRAQRALDESRTAVANWKIRRPGTFESLVPVVGPLWDAAADIQDGNYGSAAFNGAMAVADVFPIGGAVKLGRVLKALNKVKGARPLLPHANDMRRLYEKAGLIGRGQELHHTIPLKQW
jgi:hypothetical protein